MKRWAEVAGWAIVLAVILITVLSMFGAVVEIPLRMDTRYLKRLPGKTDFFYIGRLPQNNKLVAIPEAEIVRFIALAEANGFNDMRATDYGFLPPQTALSTVGKATITIEETEDIRFWRDDHAIWITWDADHPAPVATIDGEAIVFLENPGLPRAPGLTEADQ